MNAIEWLFLFTFPGGIDIKCEIVKVAIEKIQRPRNEFNKTGLVNESQG